MAAPVIAVVLIVAAGLPLSFAVTRRASLALVAAPLATALSASVAVIVMLVAGGQMIVWLAALIVAQALWLTAWERLAGARPQPLPWGSWVEVGWYVIPLVPPFLLVLAPPTTWDAHSIWWLHAAYLSQTAETARSALGNPAIVFSHTDYPPLASAPIAAIWRVLGAYDFRVAQTVSALVTLSAIALLAYAVRSVTARAPSIASRLAGVGVALAAWSVAPWAVASGLADPLWAASMTAAAVLLLFGADPFGRPGLPLLLVAATALTKNEGLVTATALAAAVAVREWRNARRAWRVWLPIALGLAWVVTARHFGATSDVLGNARLEGLLRGDPAVCDRIVPTLRQFRGTVGGLVAESLVVAALGGLFLRRERREMGLGSDLWLWVVNGAYATSLLLAYVTSTNPLVWYLSSSVHRVSTPIALMACSSLACWGASAVGAQPRRLSAALDPGPPP